MGCTSSLLRGGGGRKMKMSISDMVVFAPAMLIPVPSDLHKGLKGLVPKDLLDRLTALRNRIILLSEDTNVDDSAIPEIKQALEEYLSVLLGLTKKEYAAQESVQFKWRYLDDGRQVSSVLSSWFEVLCVVYTLAVLTLIEANMLLIPKQYAGSSDTIGTELQLGLALENQKATLSVKRRLACEQLTYFTQAHYALCGEKTNEGDVGKQSLFIRYKFLEAKAAAYFYHGLILDKSNEPFSHINAICCLRAAEDVLFESKKACLNFCLGRPVTRAPLLWGPMKHFHQKIPDTASKKFQMYGCLLDQEKGLQPPPELPEFQLSLRPDDYELPAVDLAWSRENWDTLGQPLKVHHI
ncbi:hypothetical protein Cgig2_004335 [Carnegiea gigantea]|uniref:BRO1 domain-containing protein n=1 Tax=Carnegiea gigantea TaxID=171969 RepID=A0A9Q1JYJ0_9CARY|nr:hypothetical protein Cgig2_004335 [Carnegiea gigantea]